MNEKENKSFKQTNKQSTSKTKGGIEHELNSLIKSRNLSDCEVCGGVLVSLFVLFVFVVCEMESPPAINLSSSQSSVPSSVQSFATSSSIPSSVPLSVPSSVSSSALSSSAVADLRDSYVALVVAPGFEAVHAHLRNQRSIASFMAVFLDEFSSLALEHARRLQALAESGAARFERSFVQKAWLGIRAIGQVLALLLLSFFLLSIFLSFFFFFFY